MPVPKRKRSRARRDSRFANKGLQVKSFGECSNCSATVMPHAVCKACGFYGGKKVLATKLDRSVRRVQEKAKAAPATEASAA
jgi:large subunit ribosomal protein L32